METHEINLRDWRWIVVNSSAGKDSQTALRKVVHLADAQGVSRDRIVVSHQCLGLMEWPGTRELMQEQADYYGLRTEISKYRNREGENLTLLDYVRKRGKWPDASNRYCTSEFKRGPAGRIITKLYREDPGHILNILGFRAEESTARAKRLVFDRYDRLCTKRREVWDWLPIHNWTAQEVWDDIYDSGVRHHWAYDLGMSRLSCRFCILASQGDLRIAAKANPKLLDTYCDLEEEIGHTFQNGSSLNDLRASLKPKTQNTTKTARGSERPEKLPHLPGPRRSKE